MASRHPDGGAVRAMAGYGLAIVAMIAFIPTFEIWQWMTLHLGSAVATLVPPILVLILVGAGIGILGQRPRRVGAAFALACGLALALIALGATDPAFPAKRIHVPEYVALAFLVRWAAAGYAAGGSLTAYAALLAFVLGAHDELLQGLHPDRTFGLRDVLVDGVAGAAGALIAHGLDWPRAGPASTVSIRTLPIVALAGVGAGLILFLAALPAFRGQSIPWWTIVPLLTGVFSWFLCATPSRAPGTHPANAAAWMAACTAIYPVVVNGSALDFN